MAGKIKYLIALTVVMYMIYMQGDFVIYAGGAGQTNIKGENTAVPGDGGDAGAEDLLGQSHRWEIMHSVPEESTGTSAAW